MAQLVAGINGRQPLNVPDNISLPHLSNGILHDLPPAPFFVGRQRELTQMRELWNSGRPYIVGLIGFGGAGKTALAAEFLRSLGVGCNTQTDLDSLPKPDGCFVWSFYRDQDVGTFLAEAYRYFSGGSESDSRGSTAVYRLTDLLATGNRSLIVMDGLERVQRSVSDERRMFGELEDPLLRQFLTRLAMGVGRTMCVITSRFPLSDIEEWRSTGYRAIDVSAMGESDVQLLFESHGLDVSDATAESISHEFGAHALTIDYLCTYAVEFCHGDLTQLTKLPEPDISSDSRLERKLAKVLQAYEKALTKEEVSLLCRLCVFRFGSSMETIESVFAKSAGEIAGPLRNLSLSCLTRMVLRLERLHLVVKEGAERYTSHPAVKDHFYRLFADPTKAHIAIRDHFSNLTSAPGGSLPTSKGMLDLLEEVAYHAISAGSEAEAADIYRGKLGGANHLGHGLGEYARGLRILRAFNTCPYPRDMAVYLTATGCLETALQCYLTAKEYHGWGSGVHPVLFLLGRLPEMARMAYTCSASICHQANVMRGRLGQNVYRGFLYK